MKDINGFQGRYAVTEDGRVWGYEKQWITGMQKFLFKKKARWLKPQKHKNGYMFVHLRGYAGDKGRVMSIHRLVASAYLSNTQNLPHVNHKDGNKENNNVANLEWCTAKENRRHAVDTGLLVSAFGRGEAHCNAILKEKDVMSIRELYLTGNWTHRSLAKKFGVEKSTVGYILRGKNWYWL